MSQDMFDNIIDYLEYEYYSWCCKSPVDCMMDYDEYKSYSHAYNVLCKEVQYHLGRFTQVSTSLLIAYDIEGIDKEILDSPLWLEEAVKEQEKLIKMQKINESGN